MSNEYEEVYIGDGVYARWDGMTVLLKTERDGGTHYIYLEPAHIEYIVKLMEQSPRIARRREGQG